MIKKERLYDAFGELIYAVANADGEINPEEVAALEEVLDGHDWAKEILWSFEYESKRGRTIDEAYHKALQTCKDNGPDAEYAYLLGVLQAVAEANQKMGLVQNFEDELRKKFMKDLEENRLSRFYE